MNSHKHKNQRADEVLFLLLLLPVALAMPAGLAVGVLFGLLYRRRFPRGRYALAIALFVLVAACLLALHQTGDLAIVWPKLVAHLEDYAARLVEWLKSDGTVIADPAFTGSVFTKPALAGYDWPRWALYSLPALPLGVWAALLWPERLTPERLLKKEEQRRELTERQDRRQAQRRIRSGRRAKAKDGAYLGAYVGPRRLWGNRGRDCVLPSSVLRRHVLSVGATGSGKTETLKRIIQEALASKDWQVVVVDGKGDPSFLDWFTRTASGRSRPAGVLSMSGGGTVYDGWRGDRLAILNRLAALLLPKADQVSSGSEYYRTGGLSLLDLAVHIEDDAPRSWEELAKCLNLRVLKMAYEHNPVRESQIAGLDKLTVDGMRMRAGQLAGQVRQFVDAGGWALDDGRPCYFLLDTLSYQETANALMRFIVQDVMDYVSTRKPPDRRVLVVVDEFSAVPVAALINFLERARSLKGALVLSTQDESSFGEDMRRFLTNFGAVVLHRYPEPERICALAGTKKGLAYTLQMTRPTDRPAGREGLTGLGTATAEEQFAVHPDQVRRLEPGEVFVISDGHSGHIKVAQVEPQKAVEKSTSFLYSPRRVPR